MAKDPTRQARNNLVVIGAFIFLVTVASLVLNLKHETQEYKQLAAAVGRSFYQAIETTRDWNLGRGGIYVPVTGEIRPNPYLNDALRDVVTRDGVALTKINHSHMTRLFAELLTEERGIRIHLTSMNPIRPTNTPDGWERDAFRQFREGRKEVYGVTGPAELELFRYMAPLKTEESCLTCHRGKGYMVGEALGGLSVSFSYAPFRTLIRTNEKQTYLLHLSFLVISVAMIFLLGTKLINSIKALQESQARIKRLEGMLPICAKCKKIRLEGADPFEQRSWAVLETYIQDRTDALFTHGLCPQCAKELYPGIADSEMPTEDNP